MTKPEQEIVPFIYDNKLQVCDILKKTKHLILSTKKYSNYIEKYTDITQTTTFKLPEITSYPILKNNDLIPLNKTTFNFFRPNSYGNPLFGETGTNFDNNKEIINKKSPRPKTENNVRNNPSKKIQFNSNNDECKNENISKLNISICEKNEENDLKQNEDNQNEEGDIKFNNLEEKVEIISNFYEDSKIETTKLLQENILKINQIKRSANFSENNHHIKSNSIKLKEISEMNEYLANSIKSINQKNFTSLFQSSYKETDEVNNRTIKLKSFHIQFKNLNSHNSNSTNSLEIYLPLDYIPIFYSLDSQMIIYILVMSCQFKGDSEVEFRHENVALLIERSEIFKNQTIFSPIKHFNSIKFNWFVPKIIYEVTIR